MKKPALLSLIRIPPSVRFNGVLRERARWQLTAGGPVPVCRGSAMGGAEPVGHQKKADAVAPAL